MDEIARGQSTDSAVHKDQKVQDQQISFEHHQGVLYCQVPLKNTGEKFQLVVPQSLTLDFLHYYHDNTLG